MRRIWAGLEDKNVDNLLTEVARRELLAQKLWDSDNPSNEFLGKLDEYSVLFESMGDGGGYIFPRFIAKNFPLLGLYSRNEISLNP